MALKNKQLMIVIGSMDRGGCETHLMQLLPSLVKRGYEVTVFVLARRGELAEALEREGVRIIQPWIRFAAGKSYPLWIRLLRQFVVCIQLGARYLSDRPSIVHFFLPASYWLGGLVSMPFHHGLKLMSRRSLNNYMADRPLLRKLERFLHRRMTVVLGNSKAVIRQLCEEGVPEGRLGLIYNGIDFRPPAQEEVEAFRSAAGLETSPLVLTSVANLIPYKGHVDLFEALAGIKADLPPGWVLLLAGRDDGLGAELKICARRLGIEGNIRFLGSTPGVSVLLAATDIFVLASHQEGFSNALLEASFSGNAIVATDVGGNAEAVLNDETGLIVPAHAPTLLGQALKRLAESPDLREKLGAKARIRAREHYTIENCADQYDALYCTLLETGSLDKLPAFSDAIGVADNKEGV